MWSKPLVLACVRFVAAPSMPVIGSIGAYQMSQPPMLPVRFELKLRSVPSMLHVGKLDAPGAFRLDSASTLPDWFDSTRRIAASCAA